MRKSCQKFDTSMSVSRPMPALVAVANIIGFFIRAPYGGKINKYNCEGLKPPYLVLANHGSMIDFALALKALKKDRSNWVISIEEFVGREWLLRKLGGIYKRKFTSDITVVKHILTCLKRHKDAVTIYPEARFSLAGINEAIDGALGKLVKAAKCPVVIMLNRGHFLNSPQWNKHPKRKLKVSADFKCIVNQNEAETMSADDIQKRIEENFVYDEYRWQYDNKIKITSKYRAHNIHRILYKCPSCEKEFEMTSKYKQIKCNSCGKEYYMDEYGRLNSTDGDTKFSFVPDWYRWERTTVENEVNSGNYHFKDDVRIERLVSSKDGCKRIGIGKLVHDYTGFTLEAVLDDGSKFYLHRDSETMRSCHIEYNFKKRGDALELCTLQETYFVFPLNKNNPLTKLHFATEALYDYTLKNNKIIKEQAQE